MTCPDCVRLLSCRIDGELTPSQRAPLEAHLQGCAACRRSAEQMERTVAWVRGLDRLPAPQTATRFAPLPGSLRPGWEAWRPVALAASAVLAAFLAWEGFEALVVPRESAPIVATTPAEGNLPVGGPAAAPGTTTSPSLSSGTIAALPAPAPTPPADRAGEPDADVEVAPPRAPAAPRTAAGSAPALQPPDEEPVYARIHGGRAAGEEPDRDAHPDDTASLVPPPAAGGGAAPGSREPDPAASTFWVAGGAPPPPAAPSAADGTGRVATASRSGRASSSGAAALPPATEVESSVPVVAWMDADAVRFGDPGDAAPGELVRTSEDEAATEGAAGEVARLEEAPRPGPDPRTGVTPPVPVERPRTARPPASDPEAWRLLPALSLRVTIAADGKVVDVSPLPWPGPAGVRESLVEAVRGWTFLAAERAGEAIAARLEVTIEFDAR